RPCRSRPCTTRSWSPTPVIRLHRLIDGHMYVEVCAFELPNCGHADGRDCGEERRSAQQVPSAGRPVSHLTKLARWPLMPRDYSPPSNGWHPGSKIEQLLTAVNLQAIPNPPPPLHPFQGCPSALFLPQIGELAVSRLRALSIALRLFPSLCF